MGEATDDGRHRWPRETSKGPSRARVSLSARRGLPSHSSENRHDNLDLENSSGAEKPTQRFATRVSADRHRFSGIRIKRALSDTLFEPVTTIQLKPLERDESSVLFRTRS
jgi:hypothetical protein